MMKKLSLFIERIAQYQKVLVTGPQRSGTRITAKIMSHELGYSHIDETEIGINNLSKMFNIFSLRTKFVMNCPGVSSCIHLIDEKDMVVLFMLRDTVDIQKSESRIFWNPDEELSMYFSSAGPISEIKYNCWNKFQKPIMRIPFIEFPYTALKSHNMFKEERSNFEWNQTE